MVRVFWAEDDQTARKRLQDTIPWSQWGLTLVGDAGDGEMALSQIRQTSPDILITDVRMPFMDGLALSKLVLREFPEMKIILLSDLEDFEYARTAVSLGVEQYLLKPVTIHGILPVLIHLRDRIQKEQNQKKYLPQFHRETEQYARRNFFERIAARQLTVEQIYDQARILELDVNAQSYAVARFTIIPDTQDMADSAREAAERIREALLTHFLKYPEYILVRWNLTTYMVLIKGNADKIQEYIHRCVQTVQYQYDMHAPDQNWYITVSQPIQRMSMLTACFEETDKLWAYRYLYPQQHILTGETVSFLTGTGDDDILEELDARKVNSGRITHMLQEGSLEEVPGFVEEFVSSVAEALQSKPFCQYLMLNVRFTAMEYLQSVNIKPREFMQNLNCLDMLERNVTIVELKSYMTDILLRALELRDRASNTQYRSVIRRALDYIDSHFADTALSLNVVSGEITVSPNYLSAVFSQEIGITFTEYVTGKRMEKAKELLRTTDMRSSSVAAAVGYRDSRYFSSLFKKTQGCTPRDYRAKRKESK